MDNVRSNAHGRTWYWRKIREPECAVIFETSYLSETKFPSTDLHICDSVATAYNKLEFAVIKSFREDKDGDRCVRLLYYATTNEKEIIKTRRKPLCTDDKDIYIISKLEIKEEDEEKGTFRILNLPSVIHDFEKYKEYVD